MSTLALPALAARRARYARASVRHFARRLRLACRYVYGTLSREDAAQLTFELMRVEGIYPLECLSVIDLIEDAAERFEEHPDLAELAADAADRVWSKWSSSGDAYAAITWALDLMKDYAAQRGTPFVERDP